MDREQALQNVWADLQSLLFDTQLKNGSIAWNYLNSEDIDFLSILQTGQDFF